MSEGTLWLVEKDMPAFISGYDGKPHTVIGNRQVIIKAGEIVEFRYTYGIHFRTIDDKYFYADEKTFKEHCILFGVIWETIQQCNQANTEEILRLNLYDPKLDFTDRCHRCRLKKEECKQQRTCDDCRKKAFKIN